MLIGEYIHTIDSKKRVSLPANFRVLMGKTPPQLMVRPCGVFTSREDILYVADPGVQMVHVFDLKKRRYHQIKKFGKKDFISPIGIAMDGKNNLYGFKK